MNTSRFKVGEKVRHTIRWRTGRVVEPPPQALSSLLAIWVQWDDGERETEMVVATYLKKARTENATDRRERTDL